jgi:hypothetical protein
MAVNELRTICASCRSFGPLLSTLMPVSIQDTSVPDWSHSGTLRFGLSGLRAMPRGGIAAVVGQP